MAPIPAQWSRAWAGEDLSQLKRKDVKEAIDEYLRLDRNRRALPHTDGPDSHVFQSHTNYRTLEFDRPLSSRQAHKIVRRWGEYAGVGKVSPHDLRRTVIMKLLNDGRSYREVQMVTKHIATRVLCSATTTGARTRSRIRSTS